MEINIFTDYGEVDKKIIENYAEKLGFKFPKSYIELLRKHNALRPFDNFFEIFDENNNSIAGGSIYFYGFGYEDFEIWDDEDRLRYQNSIKSYDAIELNQPDECMYENMIVFAQCANGDYIAFDYNPDLNSNNPKIVFLSHDEFTKDIDEKYKMLAVTIANDFESFMSLLKKDDF